MVKAINGTDVAIIKEIPIILTILLIFGWKNFFRAKYVMMNESIASKMGPRCPSDMFIIILIMQDINNPIKINLLRLLSDR